MSLPCTQFNPFGSQDKPLKTLKMKIERILKKFDEDTLESPALKAEAKSFAKIIQGLTEVLDEIPVHSIQPMIGEIAIPLGKLIGHFGGIQREEFNSVEFSNMFRRMSRFIQNVADKIVEPFNSEVLVYSGDLFKALLTAKHNSFRENGALLWKKTFGTIKTPLKWPGDLRELLEKFPKRLGIHLPPVAKSTRELPILFNDDEAMDGLQTVSDEASQIEVRDEVKDTSESQATFQLSQQSTINVMADKLLKDRNLKTEIVSSPKVTAKQTPTRKRTGKIHIPDEDSCDYVPITPTPPSSRRNRLTDRQKDTISKAADPRTSINYVDEESQTGIQKSEKMKNAYRALNFDIGEESMSALPDDFEKKTSRKTKQDEKPAKRILFESPVKALPVVSSSTVSLGDVHEKTSATGDGALKSPPEKRQKTDDLSDMAVKHSKPEEQLEKLPILVGDSTAVKRSGVPEPTIADSSSEKRFYVTPSESPVERLTDTKKDVESEVAKELESSSSGVVPMDDADSAKVAESPPKTPRTILKTTRRLGSLDSPLTEKKRNRVHFGVDSFPKDPPSSPMTPRKKAESKSPFKPATSTVLNLDVALVTDSKTTPFFPSLVHCQDPIDKIMFFLASMFTQKSRDYCKKKLQDDDVNTIGDFASLPKSQIDKYTWIKSRTTGAYNVLAQYEITWNSSKRVAEGVVEEAGTKHTPTRVSEISPENQSMPAQSNMSPTNEEDNNILPNSGVSDVTSQPPTGVNTEDVNDTVQQAASDSTVSTLSTATDVSTTSTNESIQLSVEGVVVPRENTPIQSMNVTAAKVQIEDRSEKSPQLDAVVEQFLEDARNLRRTCYSLFNNRNNWPTEKSEKLLESINTSSRCLKTLVREYKNEAWLPNGEVESMASNIEENVKEVSELCQKFFKYTYMSSIPWLTVMASILESTMYLDTLYSEKMSEFSTQ